MKKILSLSLLAIIIIGTLAFKIAESHVTDIFKQLGINDTEAKDYIFGNLTKGNLYYPYSQGIKHYAEGDRAGAVNEIGKYIRTYSESPEFISRYNEARSAAKPKEPESMDEYVKKRIEQVQHDLETMQEDAKKATGDLKKMYDASIKMYQDQLKVLKNPKDPYFAIYAGKTKEMEEAEIKTYIEDSKKFELEYPANPKDMIRMRLKAFLDMTDGMDFDAKLVKVGSHMKFADPKLESKDGYWKLCFRTGKETIIAARSFASQWLTDLK